MTGRVSQLRWIWYLDDAKVSVVTPYQSLNNQGRKDRNTNRRSNPRLEK